MRREISSGPFVITSIIVRRVSSSISLFTASEVFSSTRLVVGGMIFMVVPSIWWCCRCPSFSKGDNARWRHGRPRPTRRHKEGFGQGPTNAKAGRQGGEAQTMADAAFHRGNIFGEGKS